MSVQLEPAGEVFGRGGGEELRPTSPPPHPPKKAQLSHHLAGQVLALNQMRTAAGKFG